MKNNIVLPPCLKQAILPITDNIEFKRFLWDNLFPDGINDSCFSDTFVKNIFIKFYKDYLRYCQKNKDWYLWNGKKWENIYSDENIQHFVEEMLIKIKSLAEDCLEGSELKDFYKWLNRCSSLAKRNTIIKLAKTHSEIRIEPENLDNNDFLLNFNNGTLNLETFELMPHNPDDYITNIIALDYEPGLKSALWEIFLNEIFANDIELIKYVQKIVGYSLSGSQKEQCLFFLPGIGDNGKSTFMSTINELMGVYSEQTNPTTFMKKSVSSINNDVARLKGKRLVSSVETDEGQKLSASLIKSLTGGDPVSARFLFKNLFTFRFKGKIWIVCNFLPIVNANDPAMWRRIKVIPFNMTIPEGKKDKSLSDKLKSEMTGILSWAVEGCRLWQKEGLNMPESVINATQNYREELDTVGEFLKDMCVISEDKEILSSYLYHGFTQWCSETGNKKICQRDFGKILVRKGYKSERIYRGENRDKRFYKGIGLM